MSSKEIAQEVGLSHQTVDTYLKSAVAKLGADNRRDAARLFSTWEASQKSGSQPAPIASRTEVGNDGYATGSGVWLSWLMPPPVGGRINDLNAAQRSYAVIRVAVIGAVAVLALALAVAGILYTFR